MNCYTRCAVNASINYSILHCFHIKKLTWLQIIMCVWFFLFPKKSMSHFSWIIDLKISFYFDYLFIYLWFFISDSKKRLNFSLGKWSKQHHAMSPIWTPKRESQKKPLTYCILLFQRQDKRVGTKKKLFQYFDYHEKCLLLENMTLQHGISQQCSLHKKIRSSVAALFLFTFPFVVCIIFISISWASHVCGCRFEMKHLPKCRYR